MPWQVRVHHAGGFGKELTVAVTGAYFTITRVSGRSTLGELSTFQLLLYVVMGDLVQQAVTQQDYSVTSGAAK